MKRLLAGLALLFAVSINAANLPEVPQGAQAISLLGKPLYPAAPSQKMLDQLAEAKRNYAADPDDADNIIWYGRPIQAISAARSRSIQRVSRNSLKTIACTGTGDIATSRSASSILRLQISSRQRS
jgi:hypothetical protein